MIIYNQTQRHRWGQCLFTFDEATFLRRQPQLQRRPEVVDGLLLFAIFECKDWSLLNSEAGGG